MKTKPLNLSCTCLAAAALSLALSACGGGEDPAATASTGSNNGTSSSQGGTTTVGGTVGSSGTSSGTAASSPTPGTTAGATSGTTSGTTAGSTTGTTSGTPPGATIYGNLAAASLGIGASLNGAVPFPADNAWNTDISSKPVDPNSDALIASIGASTKVHPDFGAGTWEGAPIGIPYVVVSRTQAKVPIKLTDYADESDPGPYPVPADAPIEGGRLATNTGDRHVLVVARDEQRLYELGNAYPNTDGSWTATGGAIFHADSNNVRPTVQPGWTSTDAAGLPIFPGLVRYDEASKGPGGIKHALRFTVKSSRRAYVPPATHWASSNTSVNLPPMGMRVRLKAGYVIPSTFSTETKAILTALKTYGMFVADNGSSWYMTGAPDDRWDNDRLNSELGQVKGSDFEVVRMDGLVKP
jgi:hypothetical protein